MILACRNEVWAFFQSVGAASDLGFIELNREALMGSYSYFRKKVKLINEYKPETVVHIRESYTIENAFIHALRSNEKVVYRVYPLEHKSVLKRYFSGHTYTKDFRGSEDKDYLTSQADLIRRLGLESFRSTVPILPSLLANSVPKQKPYVCLCPGASVANKCWPAERYSEVANYILEYSDCFLAVCGGKSEKLVNEAIISAVNQRDRVLDYTGKTNMAGWIALIQNAVFVVCNESASVHIAACSGVPSVCIGEQKFADK